MMPNVMFCLLTIERYKELLFFGISLLIGAQEDIVGMDRRRVADIMRLGSVTLASPVLNNAELKTGKVAL